MSVVLKVENLSKQYRLGNVGTGTLSHDFSRWWHKVRGKEDPYLKVGEVNDRTQKGNSEYVWALNNINFEVQQGEILGIIGKNGAGKSTLLKILSKVTAPTTGSVKAKGRIASLLEVGTGFHPELTGRENIYLNGAILGMTKVEIRAKLDEIVDFAGVEKYLDTPVKRYSSGMTVRLGFAVAAHLEPEILIVDEVLAVGDAEFQKKAIGKMQDVSKGEGRTVLFVSHNMGVIRRLCKRGVLLKNGVLHLEDEIQNIIEMYENENSFLLKKLWSNEKYPFPYKDIVQLKGIELKSRNIKHLVNTDPISIILHYKTYKDLKLNISLRLSTIDGTCIFDTVSNSLDCSSSAYELKFIIPKDFLND
ncbi:MAG: ABC transporter ATP-binding protein, partial [Bacteroidota bacterium]